MLSDVEGGRLAKRLPLNLATGGMVWPRLVDGARARLESRPVRDAARKLILREVGVA